MTLAAVMLGLEDYAVIGGMMVAANVIILTYVRSLSSRVDRVENRVAKIEEGKVSHKDWIRIVASQTNRQDRMSRQLAEIGGKLDASVGVAAGLHRIANAVTNKAEQPH